MAHAILDLIADILRENLKKLNGRFLYSGASLSKYEIVKIIKFIFGRRAHGSLLSEARFDRVKPATKIAAPVRVSQIDVSQRGGRAFRKDQYLLYQGTPEMTRVAAFVSTQKSERKLHHHDQDI